MTINRRDMLKATAAAVALPAVLGKCAPGAGEAGAGGAPKFFTAAEFAVVDELSDMIIPTDAQSGGARAAGVAAYIDGQLAEAFDAPPENGRPPEKERWRAGLKAVEALSSEMNGKAFMESTPEQRLAVLTKMAAAESDPKTDAEKFFKEIKSSTIGAYYTSKIGIHDDQQYKGNVVQTGDYAGFDAT